jgi:hypothetical protein
MIRPDNLFNGTINRGLKWYSDGLQKGLWPVKVKQPF